MRNTDTDEAQSTPKHIGFILDGNRRWAKQRGLSANLGHAAGYKALREVLKGCFDAEVPFISIYVFSTENWKRSADEVSGLMEIALNAVTKELNGLINREVRIKFLGRRDNVSAKLLKAIDNAEQKTAHLKGSTLAICFNYGGQQEIVDACRQCLQDGLSQDQIDEQAIAERLYAPDVPPVDIIVRTSGEQRISNFMLWRSAYSELMFVEKHWPDMTKQDVNVIIDEYNRRSRRFGG